MEKKITWEENEEGYITNYNSIEFECEQDTDEKEELVKTLSEKYYSKIDEIVNFMYEDICEFYGEISKDELKSKLGMPRINIDCQMVNYFEHKLDNEHIISFEYSGLLDDFMYLRIDG